MSKNKVVSAAVNVAGPNNSITPEGFPHRWPQGTPYRSTDPVWYGCRVTVTVEGGRSYVVNIGTDGVTFRTSIFGQRESALAHVRAAAVQAYRDAFEPKSEPVQEVTAEPVQAEQPAAAPARKPAAIASLVWDSRNGKPERIPNHGGMANCYLYGAYAFVTLDNGKEYRVNVYQERKSYGGGLDVILFHNGRTVPESALVSVREAIRAAYLDTFEPARAAEVRKEEATYAAILDAVHNGGDIPPVEPEPARYSVERNANGTATLYDSETGRGTVYGSERAARAELKRRKAEPVQAETLEQLETADELPESAYEVAGTKAGWSRIDAQDEHPEAFYLETADGHGNRIEYYDSWAELCALEGIKPDGMEQPAAVQAQPEPVQLEQAADAAAYAVLANFEPMGLPEPGTDARSDIAADLSAAICEVMTRHLKQSAP